MNFFSNIAMENLDVNPSGKGKKWPKPLSVDLDQPQPLTSFDKYLIVQGTGGDALSRQSPFAIKKHFHGVESIKLLKSGDYLIGTKSEQQSQHYLKMEKVGDCLIKVKPHFGLNQIKGVIQSDALKYNTTKEQLIEELKGVGVVDCYFHQKKQLDGSMANNGRVTLTFKGQTRPAKVSICDWLHCRVFEFIPNPMRCFQCQKFGHVSKNCKGTKRCGNCGGEHHEDCREPSHCINCGGDHAAYDRDCPQWKLEKEIQKIKAKNNISYTEAKKQVASLKVTPDKPFAVVAQASPDANSTSQTMSKHLQGMMTMLNQLSNKIDMLSKRIEAVEQLSRPEIPRKRILEDNGTTSNEIRSKRMSIEARDNTLEDVDYSDNDMTEYVKDVHKTIKGDKIPPKSPRPLINSNKGGTKFPPKKGGGTSKLNQSKTGNDDGGKPKGKSDHSKWITPKKR